MAVTTREKGEREKERKGALMRKVERMMQTEQPQKNKIQEIEKKAQVDEVSSKREEQKQWHCQNQLCEGCPAQYEECALADDEETMIDGYDGEDFDY